MTNRLAAAMLLIPALAQSPAVPTGPSRLLRQPTVSATQIAFEAPVCGSSPVTAASSRTCGGWSRYTPATARHAPEMARRGIAMRGTRRAWPRRREGCARVATGRSGDAIERSGARRRSCDPPARSVRTAAKCRRPADRSPRRILESASPGAVSPPTIGMLAQRRREFGARSILVTQRSLKPTNELTIAHASHAQLFDSFAAETWVLARNAHGRFQ
jgi:hypothetical protein